MKKTVKFLTMGMLFVGITTLMACKKEDMSKYATKDDLNNYATNSDLDNYATDDDLNNSQAKVYDFTLTFGSSTTNATHTMPDGSMYNKVTFVYLDAGYKDWIMLPYYENSPGYVPVNYIATIDEVLEKIKVETLRGDNEAGSPWASNNVQRDFRAVVIEKSGFIQHENIDWANYNEVIKTLELD